MFRNSHRYPFQGGARNFVLFLGSALFTPFIFITIGDAILGQPGAMCKTPEQLDAEKEEQKKFLVITEVVSHETTSNRLDETIPQIISNQSNQFHKPERKIHENFL